MSPAVVAVQIWEHRRVIGALALLIVGIGFGLVAMVAGLFVTTPLIPPEKLAQYKQVAAGQPVEVSWQEMVALDAVRYHQDWEQITLAKITATAAQFYLCHTVKLPDGKTRVDCGRFTLDEVTERLHLPPEEQEQARRMLASIQAGAFPGAGGICPQLAPDRSPYGYVWPLQGPITDCFRMRTSPTPPFDTEMHYGVDVAAPEGTPVRAATPGKVMLAGEAGNYGNLIVLLSEDGSMITWYGHLSAFAVSRGDEVSAGHVIGYVGNTGRSTAPHLHFETRINGGNPVDPLQYYR